jgi:hypothetical protein
MLSEAGVRPAPERKSRIRPTGGQQQRHDHAEHPEVDCPLSLVQVNVRIWTQGAVALPSSRESYATQRLQKLIELRIADIQVEHEAHRPRSDARCPHPLALQLLN